MGHLHGVSCYASGSILTSFTDGFSIERARVICQMYIQAGFT